MEKIKWEIGCSGSHYKEWKGIFYPESLPQKEWFKCYATNRIKNADWLKEYMCNQ